MNDHFQREGIIFHYREGGRGIPFIFQHGIGGDVNQPFGVFKPPEGIRLLAFDFRAHGLTWPVGDPAKLTFDVFADDLIAFMDHLNIPKALIGGISMGAGVALNLALRHPNRVSGLVLSRPAWLDSPMSAVALTLYAQVAKLLREHGPIEGKQIFMASDEYRKLQEVSPDAARSMSGQFSSDKALDFVERLERLPHEHSIRDLNEVTKIQVPTIIFATRQDPIHPFEFGQQLGSKIPGAFFVEITPKSVSAEKHTHEFNEALLEFLKKWE